MENRGYENQDIEGRGVEKREMRELVFWERRELKTGDLG